MAIPRKVYTRLTRDSSGVGSYASLWLAADHLMLVRSTGYQESYSRMELSEVKAIFLTSSDRQVAWGIFWGMLFGPGALIMAIALSSGKTPIFSLIFAVAGGAGLIWNHLLGRGCRAYVLTGVQTLEVPALVRMKQARRVVARLEPLVALAQAKLRGPPG